MSIGAISTNPLLFVGARVQNDSPSTENFAPTNTNGSANSAAPLTILPTSAAIQLSFDNILALQSLTDEEPAQLTEMSATEKFLQEAQKSPMERMREQVLKQLGLSEDALSQMSPEDRRVAEDKIRELIEEKIRRAMNDGDNAPQSNAEMLQDVAGV
ncbi:hypothetical protein [Candidatus Viadribacter manganicus]|uniref:Uncharacterized protein n=1 Tax=Candidatus Viadribacter manganicus TaxID=1759059 RepID=A0A1B1AFK5_9PROT|nr:hypothetical protein [Candidatus Viadribacter manganicus]ANP45349.1 hypothetical protein ATE48_05185 [Candidatus Viadribacter manganicus]